MVGRALGVFFFAVAAIMLALFGVVLVAALRGALYACDGGGVICAGGLGSLFLGLILLTAAAASLTIGLWIRGGG